MSDHLAARKQNDLGVFYGKKGDFLNALKHFKRAIELAPTFADAYLNLGTLHDRFNRLEEALVYYQKAKAVNSSLPLIHYNMGTIYKRLGEYDKALKAFRTQISLDPNHVDTLNNIANVYVALNNRERAVDYFIKAYELQPGHNKVLSNLVWALQWLCDWRRLKYYSRELDNRTDHELRNGKRTSEQPFQNISRHDNPGLNYLVARSWSNQISRQVGADFISKSQPVKHFKSQKIKVGYLSGEFRDHPTSHLMLRLFELHDRAKFSIYAYSYGQDGGSMYRRKMIKDCDYFRDISKEDDLSTAKLIANDEIEILVDLSGHTRNNRLGILAHRPASVQVSWLGYPGSTGSNFIDYIIADKFICPQSHQKYYSEKILRVRHCYQITDNRQEIESNLSRKDFNLPLKKVIYASFCQSFKITDEIFSSWMNVLKTVTNSVLLLYIRDTSTEKYILNQAEKLGVSRNRILFSEHLPKAAHLARVRECDVVLDTNIYNGHTTTTDSLWAGTPVVTLLGNHFASRVAASILTANGLEVLITTNLSDYEKLAIELGTNKEKLKLLKARIVKNNNSHALFNTEQFVSDLENMFAKLLK